MRGLLSQLFFLFLLLLPLMAAVLSGDLLAAYCRMRGGNRPGLLPRRVSRQPGGLDGAAAPGRQRAGYLPAAAAGLRAADAAGPGAGHTPAHGGHLAGLLASVRGRRGGGRRAQRAHPWGGGLRPPAPGMVWSKGKAAGGRFSLRQTLPPPRRPLGPPAALRMFTFGKWQYPWGCDINKGNHRRDGAFGICRKAPAHKEEKHP